MANMGYNNGYQPTQFQPAANVGFWGTLLDEQWMPSELFSRLSDSIFFYLDGNPQISYPNSGYIEPDKNMWWSTYVGTVQQEKAVVDYVMKHAMGSLYDSTAVPYTIVTTQNGHTMPILDRLGFLHSLIASAKVDPAKFLQKLNKSLASFNLADPATNQPFPGPIPATAMPMVCDWSAHAAFTNWQMTVGMQYRTHAIQKHQKNAARGRLVHGAFNMLSGGLTGGTGFGGGGATGFGGGGGTTGFGF